MNGIGKLPRQAVGYQSVLPHLTKPKFPSGTHRSCRAGNLLSPLFLLFVLPLFGTVRSDGAVTDNGTDLIIPEGETYTKFGSWTYSNSVEIRGRLIVGPFDGSPGSGTVKLTAPTIVVHSSGVIDADYAGWWAGLGPGVGISPPGCAGSGAGYGNPGGKGYGLGAKGGLPYGYPSGAVHMGSGGLSTETATGGRGGGAIHLRGSESITISGTITAAGQDGESDPAGYAAGGGSGGGILIDGSGAHVAMDGLVSSKGGNGGDGKYGGGGGAGGRIRVFRGPEPDLGSAEIRCMWGEAGASEVMDFPPERGSSGSGWTPERQPTYTPPSISLVEAEPPHSASIRIGYTLWDAEADMCSLDVECSTDGGVSFRRASLSPIWYGMWRNGIWDPYYPKYGTEELRPYRPDWRSSILWDSLKDIGMGQARDVRIRITPTDGFEQPSIPGVSPPFSVDNRFVTPGAPKLEYQGPTYIGLSIYRNGIYPPAEFAIFNATVEKYVDAEGRSVSETPVWRGEFEWGTVEVKELNPDTTYSFRVKARDVAIGLETELGPALAASTTPQAASAETDRNGVSFRLVLDKSQYQVAEAVHIQYIVTNRRTTTFSIEFPCAHQVVFLVYGPKGLLLGPPQICLPAVTVLTLEPGETYVYSATWGGGDWPGQYSVRGYLDRYEFMTSVSVGFEVVGPLQKRISGRLLGDTVLTKQGSPFYVPEDLIVPAGMTLTIEPGVELRFDYRTGSQIWSWSDRGAALAVHGTLIARGTPEDPIIFRSSRTPYPSVGDWRGITFVDTAADAIFDTETGRYVEGCILEHCVIEYALTPLSITDCSPLISNCVFRYNGELKEPPELQTDPPPLIIGKNSSALFVNNVIVRSFKFISGDFTFVNCIIWHNINLKIEGVTANYCNIEGGYPGEGNINADPLFADLSLGDYRLLPGSPCIDAGTNDVQGLPDFDMDGDPRISGGIVDMGVDEYTDEDGDGLLDYLERLYFGSLLWGPDDDPDEDDLTVSQELDRGTHPARSDTDGDGIPDGKEVAAGTDPLDSNSCLKVILVEPGDFATYLWWKSVPSRRYCVFVSEDMQTWVPRSGELTASSGTLLFVDSHGGSIRCRFYRIEALP